MLLLLTLRYTSDTYNHTPHVQRWWLSGEGDTPKTLVEEGGYGGVVYYAKVWTRVEKAAMTAT